MRHFRTARFPRIFHSHILLSRERNKNLNYDPFCYALHRKSPIHFSKMCEAGFIERFSNHINLVSKIAPSPPIRRPV